MALKLKSLRADTSKELDGDWIDVPDLPGVALKVRSIYYEPYTIARDAATRRLAKKYGDKPIPETERTEINARLYVDHLLLDWKGFDVDFSTDVALEALSDIGHRDLRSHVVWACVQVGKSDVEFVELGAKN